MGSHSLESFCQEVSYIAAFNILNLPSLDVSDSPQRLPSNLSWLATSNITTYTSSPTSILLNNFKYEEITSLPLVKPLAIHCPVPACIFPISGYFTFLQRLLLYINIGIATFALHVPLLRGVSQIWLTTFWVSVLAMYLTTIITTKVPMIYNLDLQPAAFVVHIGLLPTLLWFSFRAEPGKSRHHAEGAVGAKNPEGTADPEHPEHLDDSEDPGHSYEPEDPEEVANNESRTQRRKRGFSGIFSGFPVTRILVPLYALFGVGNIILANVVQGSGGFWPTATGVILSNGTSYLLTGPCFEDPSGFVGLWPPSPSPYNGIRNLSSLSIYYPPPGSSAVDALQAVPRTTLTPLHIGSVLICFVIIILSFTTLNWLERRLHRRVRRLEDFLHIRLNSKWKQYRDRAIQYLAILPFAVPLVGAVVITFYVIIVFEANAHRAVLPENEAYTEVGQWGPFVVAGLVFAATLTAKWNGWDFDKKNTEDQNRSFEWLLVGDRPSGSRDSSRERLVPENQQSFPSLPDIPTSPIQLQDWGLRRGSQAR